MHAALSPACHGERVDLKVFEGARDPRDLDLLHDLDGAGSARGVIGSASSQAPRIAVMNPDAATVPVPVRHQPARKIRATDRAGVR